MLITRSGIGVLSLLALLVLIAVILHAFQSDGLTDITVSTYSSSHSLSPPIPSASALILPPLSSYSLVFSDEFDGDDGSAPSASHWNLEKGCGLYNGELQCYTQSLRNAHIEKGHLSIIARYEATEEVTAVSERVVQWVNVSTGGMERREFTRTSQYSRWFNYTSARLTTQHLHEVAFPRVQAAIRIPQSLGVWPALWLLGRSIEEVGWPQCGEVDVLEAVNTEGLVHSSLHWNEFGTASTNTSHRQLSASALPQSSLSSFHIYEVAMEEERVVFALDGFPFFVVDLRGREELEAFSGQGKAFFLLLNMAVGGWWPGWTVDVEAFPVVMEVDWVRVYQRRR